jgi:hypothetical protein
MLFPVSAEGLPDDADKRFGLEGRTPDKKSVDILFSE